MGRGPLCSERSNGDTGRGFVSSLGPAVSLSLQDSGDVEATENANTGMKGLQEIDSKCF